MSGSGPVNPDSGLPDDLPDDLDIRAAEYALGVLDDAEARALEALSFNDPAVANSIAAWEARLAPLAEVVPPLTPPPVLWQRLALATGIESVIRPVPASDKRPGGGRVWRGAALWRATTAGALAIAASLAFLLYTETATTPVPLVAALVPSGMQGATFLVRVAPDGSATVAAVGDPAVPQGRSLQLWALKPDATVPVSMGLLPSGGRGRLTIQEPAETRLLVSQEPAGGSPTKLPTGPVVYSGRLTGL